MQNITDELNKIKGLTRNIAQEKYHRVLLEKKRDRSGLISFSYLKTSNPSMRIIAKTYIKIRKLKRIGFPLRYIKTLLHLVSYTKRIEELERQNYQLLAELEAIRKKIDETI